VDEGELPENADFFETDNMEVFDNPEKNILKPEEGQIFYNSEKKVNLSKKE